MKPEVKSGERNVSVKTGWESVAALADRMGQLGEADTEDESKVAKSIEEIDATCEQLFGRNRDRLAREFQVVGLIDGYKRWGLEEGSRETHREILRAVRDDQIARREPDVKNADGSIRKMAVVLKDGRVLSEERVYDVREPSYNQEKVESYIEDGVISEQEASDIELVYKVLMGEDLPDDIDTAQLRRNVGVAKEKILEHYNEAYQRELFHDDGVDREGLTHEELEDGTPVVRFDGAPFKILAHVRNAMHTVQGEKTAGDLLIDDPRHEWETPRPGSDFIPHGLSTSLISSEKINIYKKGEIIFGFTDIRNDSIVSMSEEDAGSSISSRSRYDIIGHHGNERLMMPDELIEKTDAEGAMTNFNEVVLDRLAGGELIMPSCMIVFGESTDAITDLQRQYAKSFGVPIYLINDKKYGGARALGD